MSVIIKAELFKPMNDKVKSKVKNISMLLVLMWMDEETVFFPFNNSEDVNYSSCFLLYL